jgi:hypothetical protein
MFKNPKAYAAQLKAAFPAGTDSATMVGQAMSAHPSVPTAFWFAVQDALLAPPPPTLASMAVAVYEHAERNYEKAGWDFIVECWTLKEIEAEIKGCRSYNGAIAKMARFAKAQDERRREVRAEADDNYFPPEG